MRSQKPCLLVPQQPHNQPPSSERVLQRLAFPFLKCDQNSATRVVLQAHSTPSSVMKSHGVT
jgi:hypothetical protein